MVAICPPVGSDAPAAPAPTCVLGMLGLAPGAAARSTQAACEDWLPQLRLILCPSSPRCAASATDAGCRHVRPSLARWLPRPPASSSRSCASRCFTLVAEQCARTSGADQDGKEFRFKKRMAKGEQRSVCAAA